MTNAFYFELQELNRLHPLAWIPIVLFIGAILVGWFVIIDGALGFAAARLVHSGNVVSIEERRRQLKAASEAVR
jgi:hypothetical protein